jgi:hypothetical protein
MRSLWQTVWAIGLVGLTALPTLGQQQPPSRGSVRGGPNPLLILRHKPVQEELKLSEEQVEKIKEIMGKMRDKMLALIENGERDKVQPVIKELEKDLFQMLKADQAKRLKEVVLQVHGLWAMTTPDTAKELQLTEEQTKKLRDLQAETEKQMDKLYDGDIESRKEIQKKLAELHTGATDKGLQVLTEKQRVKWKEMAGEPFKGEIPRVRPSGLRKDK